MLKLASNVSIGINWLGSGTLANMATNFMKIAKLTLGGKIVFGEGKA